MRYSVLRARVRESMCVIQQLHRLRLPSLGDTEHELFMWVFKRRSRFSVGSLRVATQSTFVQEGTELLHSSEINVFSCQHYCPFIFPFYTTVTVIQDWRKKQLRWGTALKHSCFVPFLLVQTFHGLSTWITFWWCRRNIFARANLIAV